MNMKEAALQFNNLLHFTQPEDINELMSFELKYIDKVLHGKTNRIRTDSLKRAVKIGDLVSYSKIGGTFKGVAFGIVVGFTDAGFRVIQIHLEHRDGYFYPGDLQTPGSVVLIQSHKGNL